MTATTRPLDGLRVIEMGQLVAGPMAGMIMAYFGAEVIKVEPPKGDPLRRWREMENGTSLWWRSMSRNKRCIALDLRDSRGQAIARRLIAGADVLIENFRPGTLENWGLDPAVLSAADPKLIVSRISGYGQTGPYAERAGYASACEAFGGFRYVNGHPGQPPVRPNLSLGDSLAGLHAAMGILLALYHRDRRTPGEVDPNAASSDVPRAQQVDVAIYESVINMLESVIPECDRLGVVREPAGTTITGVVPSGTYTCADGAHVVLGANGDAIFQRLCGAMGRGDLATDPQLHGNPARVAQRERVDAAIRQWTGALQSAEVLRRLHAAAVPCSAINDAAALLADPHCQARGIFEEVDLEGRPLKLAAVAPKLSATPGRSEWAGRDLGADSAAVLAEIGVTAEELAVLRTAGIVV